MRGTFTAGALAAFAEGASREVVPGKGPGGACAPDLAQAPNAAINRAAQLYCKILINPLVRTLYPYLWFPQ